MAVAKLTKCLGCGGLFPDIDGPVLRYMESSPGCWAAFGEVLAREYSEVNLAAVHRLSVDSYAVQHPGGSSRQSFQSVGVHLVRLHLFIEKGLSADRANDAMLKTAKHKHTFTRLEAPCSMGAITLANVAQAKTVDAHMEAVKAWTQSSWAAWGAHHATIRAWAAQQAH